MQTKGIKQRVTILNILSKERFISGERIASKCNISRIAVWKHINYLINNGVKIKIHPNKGYEFFDFGSRFLPEVIEIKLKKRGFIRNIICLDEVDSTNEYAKKYLKEKTLLTSEQQIKGKGRLGRKWLSEKGKDILCSFILSPLLEYQYLPIFNIIGSLSVAGAVKNMLKIDAKTKWPNDVLVAGKKIAGILVEFIAQIDIIDKLILGMGINVNSTPSLKKSGSLISICDRRIDRTELLVSIIFELEKNYTLLENGRFSKVVELWKKCSYDYQKKVKIYKNSRPISGVSYGIDIYGNLILKNGQKKETVYPSSSMKIPG